MSKADIIFRDVCLKILNEGISDENMNVRPKWEDGTPAYTRKVFGVVNRYNLQEEFPLMTMRRTYWKSALDELLWIYQKKSNDIHNLRSHVWDQWADETGSIGKAYGYQMSVKHPVAGVKESDARLLFGENGIVHINASDPKAGSITDFPTKHLVINDETETMYMDQVDKALYDLSFNPASRRIITTTYIPADLTQMHLAPCAYSMTFNVTGNKLNAILNQRSQDMLAASNWNVIQYSMLLMLFAKVSGFEPGELVHVIADCHIYDRHIPIVEELIEQKMYDAPGVVLDPNLHNFYDANKNSFALAGDYMFSEFDHKIPIAV